MPVLKQNLKGIISAVLLVSSLSAGTTGKLTGQINAAVSGEPLIGCNVLIEGTDLGAATDMDGRYYILNIPPGIYTVKALMIGYTTTTVREVEINVDLTTTVDFSLGIEVLGGEEVTVIAERGAFRQDLTHSEARVTADQLEVMPINEIWDVLALQGTITTDAGGGIHIRGGRSREVAYWVDGVSVTDAYDGGLSVAVDNNAIQELQVISGTFNAEYGQAMSGIINLVTKDGGKNYTGFFSTYGSSYLTDSYFPVKPDTLTFSKKLAIGSNPLFSNENNVEFSLSGPVPFTKDKLTFYSYFRRNKSDGWLNGWRIFNPYGIPQVQIGFKDDGTLMFGDPEMVPMNWRNRTNGNLKLTYSLNPVMKLRLSYLGSVEEYQDYEHNDQHSPDGRLMRFNAGTNLRFNFTHSLSSRTFYTLDLTQYSKNYHHYTFKNQSDSSYIDPYYFFHQQITLPPSTFKVWGVDLRRFERNTITQVAKFDLTSQLTAVHQVKFGLEYRQHNLDFDDYELQDANETDLVFSLKEPGNFEVRYDAFFAPWNSSNPGSWVVVDTLDQTLIGWDWHSSKNPAQTGFASQQEALDFIKYFNKNVQFGRGYYEETPRELSAYIQDKIEYENVIVNLGLRFDLFDANAVVPRNPAEPYLGNPRRDLLDLLSLREREEVDWSSYVDPDGNGVLDDSYYSKFLPDSGRSLLGQTGWWRNTSLNYQLSPRLSIAYPITDKGVIHFAFGHFFQTPSFEYLYVDPGYKIPEDIGRFGIFRNPNLNPQKTVMYELGLRQEVIPGFQLDVTGYYRDVRNWVTTGIPVEISDGASYYTYINRDYSNVRGVTVNIDKRLKNNYGFNLNYTYQIAEGSNSLPDQEYSAAQDNEEPTRMILPLDWDQTQTINGVLYLGSQRWNLSLTGRFGSGYPYTPAINKAATQGINTAMVNLTNSRRKPITYNLDLNLIYTLPVRLATTQVYLKVFNLLDKRNELTVYEDTGRSTGTLDISSIEELGRPNTVSEYYNRRDWFSAPRQIQLGIKLNL